MKFTISQHPTNAQENLLATYRGIEQRGELKACDDKIVQNYVDNYYKNRDGWRVRRDKHETKTIEKLGLG